MKKLEMSHDLFVTNVITTGLITKKPHVSSFLAVSIPENIILVFGYAS